MSVGLASGPRVATSGSVPSHGRSVGARGHCLSLVRAADRPTAAARYGRMFPDLDPLRADPRVLMRAGGKGEICDAAAALGQISPGSDDATEAAGWPFFGQLVAHDITADRSPCGCRELGHVMRPAVLVYETAESVSSQRPDSRCRRAGECGLRAGADRVIGVGGGCCSARRTPAALPRGGAVR